MLSRIAFRPSARLAPFLPSARSSAARSFIAARSSALNPSDFVAAFLVAIFGLPLDAHRFGSGPPVRRKASRVQPQAASRFLTAFSATAWLVLVDRLVVAGVHLKRLVPDARGTTVF